MTATGCAKIPSTTCRWVRPNFPTCCTTTAARIYSPSPATTPAWAAYGNGWPPTAIRAIPMSIRLTGPSASRLLKRAITFSARWTRCRSISRASAAPPSSRSRPTSSAARTSGFELGPLGQPQVAVIHVLRLLVPRSAAREVDDRRRTLRRLLVPALQPIPHDRQRADIRIGSPLHAMQVGARLRVDDLGRQRAHRRMLAIEQHQRRPVLARINGLHRAVHFDLL